jgi:O-antigen/teichoic acid export membrane protein
MGVVGVLYSSLISGTLVTVVLAIYTVREVGLRFNGSKLRQVAAFGAPLILTSAAAFIVNFSDRFFLRHFCSIATVGVYALGYKFGFMLSLLVVQPFDMIWQARLYEIGKQDSSGRMFAKIFEYYCFVLVAAALALSIGIKELLTIISPGDFHVAYTVVPIIALAYVFQGANRFFLAGTYIAKKTVFLAAVGLASAAGNIGLNIFLIPRYGMLGAAWATAFSFFLMAVLALQVSQRLYPIPYAFSRVAILLGLAVAVYFVSSKVTVSSHAVELSIKLALLAAFPAVLYLFGFFHQQEVATGRVLAREILGRYRLLRAVQSG